MGFIIGYGVVSLSCALFQILIGEFYDEYVKLKGYKYSDDKIPLSRKINFIDALIMVNALFPLNIIFSVYVYNFLFLKKENALRRDIEIGDVVKIEEEADSVNDDLEILEVEDIDKLLQMEDEVNKFYEEKIDFLKENDDLIQEILDESEALNKLNLDTPLKKELKPKKY